MDVRRPLHALPLACFLPLADTPSTRTSPYKSSTKRSRSPSAMLSPAKRRILHQEGYLASPSLEAKINTSREKSSKGDDSPRGRLRPRTVSAAREDPRRTGADSPFNAAVADRPRSNVPSASDIIAYNTQSSSKLCPGDSYDGSSCPSAYQRVAPPLIVPREMPPRPDPQSLHYPGFDIHYDTHIELPSTSSRLRPDMDIEKDEEDAKENLPLKKLAKKIASVLVEAESTRPPNEAFSDMPRPVSLPTTPYRRKPFPGSVAPAEERGPQSRQANSHGFTPGRTPGSALSKLVRRQTLKDEVDDACSDDEGM